MKITLPITIDIDLNDWREEYGLATDAEATAHVHESLQNAAHQNWAPLALVQAWPVLRDLATVTAGTPYRADDPGAAVGALIDSIGLDAVAQVVRHRERLAAADAVVRVVRAAVARENFGPDAVPVAVVFHTMDYDNGAFVYDGSATVFFSDEEDDSIEFADADARVLNDALNPDGPCAPGVRVLVNLTTGWVERYEPNEHDGLAADLYACMGKAGTSA